MLSLITQAVNPPQVVDIAGRTSQITNVTSVGKIVEFGAGMVLVVGALAFLVYLLMAGFNWITAGGDKGKIEEAKSMLVQGIIGLTILASVFAVYRVVLRVLGITSISVGQSTSGVRSTQSTTGKPATSTACGTYCAGPDQCAETATSLCDYVGYSTCSKNTSPCVRGK